MANGREPLGTGVIWLLGQMVRLPVEAFVYTMEMMVKTLQGLQKMADRSVDALMGRDAPSLPDAPAVESNLSNGPTVGATAHAAGSTPNSESDHPNDTVNLTPDAITSGGEKIEKEQRNMPDTNLSDDMLKLVRYKILFVKRDYEVAFKEEEELVSDNMTETAYAAWKVAEFIQKLKDGETRVPDKWLKVTREEGTTPKFEFESDGDKLKPILKGLKEDDKKYLRVFFEVLQRYPREKFKYEERQIEVLEEIRNKIK
jgi:hypothetical protein